MNKNNLSPEGSLPLLERIDNLSKLQKILICTGLLIVILAVFVWFFYLPKFEKIGQLKEEYAKLEKELATVKKKARELKRLRAEMEKAEADFRLARKKLPETEEIPDLLASISRSGQETGLEFLLFQPKAEIKKDFYAEIPVLIKVLGSYIDVGIFFEKVARLPRIVNLRDISMAPTAPDVPLTAACTAVTYKFVEPVEAAEGEGQDGQGDKLKQLKSKLDDKRKQQ